LIAVLDRDLATDGTNLIGLSGGVDSSVVASLAVGPCQRRLAAFTLTSGEGDPNAPFVDSIAAHVEPLWHRRFSYRDEDFVRMRRRSPRLRLPIAHPALIELPGLLERGPITVYTGGEVADDLFAGPYLAWGDGLTSLTPTRWLRALADPSLDLPRRLVARRWLGHQRRGRVKIQSTVSTRLSDIVVEDLRDEYREWALRFRAQVAADPSPYWQLNAIREMDGWIFQNWEVCSEFGVRRSVPFHTRELLELAYSVHPSDQAPPTKRLLRLAGAGHTPPMNLWRHDKGAGNEPAPVRLTEALPSAAAQVVKPERCAPGSLVSYSEANLIEKLSASLTS
jgi:asparagine synthetase B (glutamine-hydrolysing)